MSKTNEHAVLVWLKSLAGVQGLTLHLRRERKRKKSKSDFSEVKPSFQRPGQANGIELN